MFNEYQISVMARNVVCNSDARIITAGREIIFSKLFQPFGVGLRFIKTKRRMVRSGKRHGIFYCVQFDRDLWEFVSIKDNHGYVLAAACCNNISIAQLYSIQRFNYQ